MFKRFTVFAAALIIAAAIPFAAAGGVAEASADGFEYFDELMGEYTTSYSSSGYSRKHNIKLASDAIDGKVVAPGEEFSFNVTVGVRSEKRGYLSAPVIVNGEYTKGTGGGVCQVSTTLYNAVLRSGVKVTKVSAHSLPVSYVPYSMDAMVSEATDFRFLNDTPYPVRIQMKADGERLKASLYGFPVYTDGISVRFDGRVLKKIECGDYVRREALSGELKEGEREKIVRAPSPGYYTEAVMSVYYGKDKVEEHVVRRDYYAPVKGIVIYTEAREAPVRPEEGACFTNSF